MSHASVFLGATERDTDGDSHAEECAQPQREVTCRDADRCPESRAEGHADADVLRVEVPLCRALPLHTRRTTTASITVRVGCCRFISVPYRGGGVSTCTVRTAVPSDARAIQAVAERAWPAAHGDILGAETIDSILAEWYDVESTRDAIERDDVGYFVAEDDGDIRGYVSGGRTDDPDVASLAAIYVDPDHWGDGIGTALAEQFHDFCRRRGYERVRLCVLAENDRAQSFYRGHGYEQVDEEETELFGERALEATYARPLD